MIVHQVFAFIVNEEIKNIAVCDNYELANSLSRMVFGEEASAWECTQYPVSIGDKCKDRVFYFKDGITLVPRTNTAEEDASIAKNKVTALENENFILKNRLTLAEGMINEIVLTGGIA